MHQDSCPEHDITSLGNDFSLHMLHLALPQHNLYFLDLWLWSLDSIEDLLDEVGIPRSQPLLRSTLFVQAGLRSNRS
jgi:hypothetical protein